MTRIKANTDLYAGYKSRHLHFGPYGARSWLIRPRPHFSKLWLVHKPLAFFQPHSSRQLNEISGPLCATDLLDGAL